jgi:hypothetical protein
MTGATKVVETIKGQLKEASRLIFIFETGLKVQIPAQGRLPRSVPDVSFLWWQALVLTPFAATIQLLATRSKLNFLIFSALDASSRKVPLADIWKQLEEAKAQGLVKNMRAFLNLSETP